MKKYILTLITLIAFNTIYAQEFFDALNFSQTVYNGSARATAMGNAFGALGSDFVSASINPAGMGMYRSGEFAISPYLKYNKVNAILEGQEESDFKYKFGLNNSSYTSVMKTNSTNGIVSITFGFGYNRLKDFNSNYFIQNDNATSTLLDYYVTNSLNENVNPLYEQLAWDANLIYEDTDLNVIEGYTYNDFNTYSVYEIYEDDEFAGYGYESDGVYAHRQKQLVSNTGKIDEYIFSTGLNINYKLYIGATIGFDFLTYNQYSSFYEYDNNDASQYMDFYRLKCDIRNSGFGANFKLGAIYRPTKSLRLGVAVHTPTFYTIDYYKYNEIEAYYDQSTPKYEWNENTESYNEVDNSDYYSSGDVDSYSYKLITPAKFIFSGAYSFGNKAVISADYELTNYASNKFNHDGDGYDYSENNSDIQNTLRMTGNLRVGGEYLITSNFSLRAGYNLIGNAWLDKYTDEEGTTYDITNSNDTYSIYSAGFGYRQNNFFIDFAYKLGLSNTQHQVFESYSTTGDNIATLKETNNQATITFGFRF